jgi:hypothetical protein
MAKQAKKELCDRWKKKADYPAGIGCALLYLEVKIKDELTLTLDSSVASTNDKDGERVSVPIKADDNIIRDLMKKRVKQKRAWNKNQFIISFENQVANGRLIKVNGKYKLDRKFITVVAKSNGKIGSSPRRKSETNSGTEDKKPKRLLKSQQPKSQQKRQVAPRRRRQAMPRATF